MRKCQKCWAMIIGYDDYCRDCQLYLNAEAASIWVDEREVRDFSQVASEALHGRQEHPARRWWCRQPRYDGLGCYY